MNGTRYPNFLHRAAWAAAFQVIRTPPARPFPSPLCVGPQAKHGQLNCSTMASVAVHENADVVRNFLVKWPPHLPPNDRMPRRVAVMTASNLDFAFSFRRRFATWDRTVWGLGPI